MGNTVTIDANQAELWSKKLMKDVGRDVANAMRFVTTEEDGNGVVMIKRDLAKVGGDTQNFTLIARLSGDGVTGDAELEGNEESMDSFNEQIVIDQIRNAVRLKGKLDAQKVVYDQIKPARENLRIWMKEYTVRQIMNKLGGVTNTTLTDVNGKVVGGRVAWSNTPAFIPATDTASATGSGDRYLNAAGHSMATADSGDTMSLDLVTDVATKAELADPKIQRISSGGDEFWVMYLHPLQVRDIRKSDDWKTAQQNARDRSESNPVFKGALGFWSNVLLLSNEFVPFLDISAAGNSFRGAASGTNFGVDTARALLCGRQAVGIAEASNPDALVVEQFDYKNKDGVAINGIFGVQKIMFNSLEFGVIAVDTAAVA
jgi:N4-gp56 family major capsid protein